MFHGSPSACAMGLSLRPLHGWQSAGDRKHWPGHFRGHPSDFAQGSVSGVVF